MNFRNNKSVGCGERSLIIRHQAFMDDEQKKLIHILYYYPARTRQGINLSSSPHINTHNS